MAHFMITQQDLLVISLTAHICVMVELIANRLIEWVGPALSERSSMIRTLMNLQKQRPGLLAKVLMEQITLWSLILLIMVALAYTSVSVTPFSHQPLPYPAFLIRIILSANVARFSVMAARIVLVRDIVVCQTKTVATPGQSGNSKLDFLYSVFSASTTLICLAYHENLLLGVTSSFMEVSSTPVECCRLMEHSKKSAGSRSYRKTTILSCALCVLCRVFLPLLFLILASSQESPFNMNEVPLVCFFTSGVFYSTFNGLLLCQSISRMREASHQCRSRQLARSSSTSTPFSIHMLSNDIAESKVRADNVHCHHKDFNYGLLRSFDNRNLYCTLVPENTEKVNVSKKKNISKNSALHKTVQKTNGDIFRKMNFNRKGLEKSRSHDFLLGSQDLFSEKEADVLMVARDNDCMNYDQSEISHEVVNKNSTNTPGNFDSSRTSDVNDKSLSAKQQKLSGHNKEMSTLLNIGQFKTEGFSRSAFNNLNKPLENAKHFTSSNTPGVIYVASNTASIQTTANNNERTHQETNENNLLVSETQMYKYSRRQDLNIAESLSDDQLRSSQKY